MKRLAKADALAAIAAERATEHDAGCLGCRLASEPEPIASNPHAVAVVDRYASRPGHVLVVARRHVERIGELPWDEYAAIQRLVWSVSRGLERALSPRWIYVAQLGSADPIDTSFPHLHVHLVPLADGGQADRPASVFTWAHGVYVFESPAEARELCDLIRAAMTSG